MIVGVRLTVIQQIPASVQAGRKGKQQVLFVRGNGVRPTSSKVRSWTRPSNLPVPMERCQGCSERPQNLPAVSAFLVWWIHPYVTHPTKLHNLRTPLTVIATYSLSYTLPTMVKNLGYSAVKAQALTTPPYIFATCVCVTAGWLSDKYQKRYVSIMSCYALGLT